MYRFATYLQRAVELASDVRGYGALILAALEWIIDDGIARFAARNIVGRTLPERLGEVWDMFLEFYGDPVERPAVTETKSRPKNTPSTSPRLNSAAGFCPPAGPG